MSAVACLRVDVSAHRGGSPAANLGPLVQKFAGAYLETRWNWPRRFFPLAEFSFLLIDPRADVLDVAELQRLSDELQRHLFGTGDEGAVALLVFEGTHPAVTEFAGLDRAALAAAVADPALLPRGGRLTRILPSSLPQEVMRGTGEAAGAGWTASPTARAAAAPGAPEAPATAWEGAQGVYFTPRQVFFGDVATYIPANGKAHLSIVDGPEHMPRDVVAFDAACLTISVRFLVQRGKGTLLYLPLCYNSLVRPSLRGAYEAMFAELPRDRRGELAATVYDVPRDPMFTGLKQVRAFLEPYFSVVDLRVTDPGFEIEKLPPESANSVTLMLPDGDPLVRLSALRRFGERIVHYKQRRIWPAITNVRRRAEVEAASRLHIPFLTGPAICSPAPSPVGGRTLALEKLPMTLGEWMNLRDQSGATLRTA